MDIKTKNIELKSKSELAAMKNAGQLAGLTLAEVGKHLEVGITTNELDKVANRFVKERGGIPTFVGYRGYPATICVSINDEVVHGIPSKRKLKEGDIVSVDFAATLEGFVGDTAKTWIVGKPKSEEDVKLVEATRKSLDIAIQASKVGNRLGDVGNAVQSYIEGLNFGVVRDFVGHGIGRQMHEDPAVPNYGEKGTGMRLEPGLVIAIEPMVTRGDWKVKVLKDGWTVITLDGSNAAHFEHTIAVTEEGPQILTEV